MKSNYKFILSFLKNFSSEIAYKQVEGNHSIAEVKEGILITYNRSPVQVFKEPRSPQQ